MSVGWSFGLRQIHNSTDDWPHSAISDPQTLYAQPANQMVATFLGSPPMNLLPACYEQGMLQIGQNRLSCPITLQQVLSDRSSFNLGIRPEHLQVVPEHLIADNLAHLIGIVSLIEPLGRENLVRAALLRLESSRLQFWLPASYAVKVSDRLRLGVELEQLYGFDPKTGQALRANQQTA